MPIPVVNPLDGDDLHASSITVNVTDKIVAWAASHETGATTNGALRHMSAQIDDLALTETTAYAAAMDQHGRNDTFASGISALAGGSATGYAARLAALGALPYRNIQAINTELATNAVATASASQLVRRRADGSADFAATSSFATIVASGTIAATGNITGNNIDANGVLIAGSGNIQITTAAGNLDATKLSGPVSAGSMPALTGDVTTSAGSVATTVATVGTKTAAAIAASVVATTAASGTAVGNHGNLAKYDASGGMTFDGTVTGTTIVATTFSGTATAVAASGIAGQITATQADATIAKTANVPTNAGIGATGTWGISITGSATTVAAGGVATAAIVDGAVTTAKILDGAVAPAKLLAGRVTAKATPSLLVDISGFNDYSLAGLPIIYSGILGLDLSSHVPGVAGNRRFVLIYVNSTAVVGVKDGALDPTSPVEPSADLDTVPLAVINLQFGQTAIAQGDILDRRTFLRRIGTGGGTGGGIPTDAPIVTVGPYGTTTAETDIFTLADGTATGTINGKDLATWRVDPGRVRRTALEAPLSDKDNLYIQPDLVTRISQNGTDGVQIAAGLTPGIVGPGSPLTLSIGGRSHTNTATVIARATGGAGQRYLIADGSAVSTGFTIALVAPPLVLGQYQMLLEQYYWNGSTLWPAAPFPNVNAFQRDSSPLFSIDSIQVRSNFWPWQAGGVDTVPTSSPAGSFAVATNMPVVTFNLAGTFHVKVTTKVRIQQAIASGGDVVECHVAFDAATSNVQVGDVILRPPTSVTSGVIDVSGMDIGYTGLGSGLHTIGMYWNNTAAAATTLLTRYVLVEFYA
jgi:hypothetical protein